MQRGLLVNLDYKVEKDKKTGRQDTVIYQFIRGEDGRRHLIKEFSFLPYFYMLEKQMAKVSKLTNKLYSPSERYTSFRFRESLKKLYVKVPHEVGRIRRFLEGIGVYTWEADILFALRYMIDTGIHAYVEYDLESGKVNPVDDELSVIPRIATLDIEALSGELGDFVDIQGPEEICCITVHDSYTDVYYVFYVNPSSPIRIDKDNVELVSCYSEENLLFEFKEFITKRNFDVLSGFYLSRYDLPKIVERMKVCNIDHNKLSPLGYVRMRQEGLYIKGRSVFDVFMAYKRYVLKELAEYSLDFIAKEEKIEEGKMKLPYATFKEAWEKDPELVIKYNIRDVQVTKEINDKLDLFGQFYDRAKIAGVRLEDVFKPSRVIDVIYLRHAREMNLVLPTKRDFKKVDFPGAWVDEPESGTLYNSVGCFDFSEMYPSIIEALNISSETWRGKYGDLKLTESTSFTSEYRGILPIVVSTYRERRKRIKAELKKATGERKKYLQRRSSSLKSIINATYGLSGLPFFRLYDPIVAASITLTGRMLIQYVAERAEKELEYDVVYGDTDSIFINLHEMEKIVEEALELVPLLNEYTRTFCEGLGIKDKEAISINLDKLYSHFIVLTKKRYYGKGIWRDGSLEKFTETKGIELARSDACQCSKEIQEHLLEMTLQARTPDDKIQYLMEKKEEFKNEKYKREFFYFGVPTQVRKLLTTPEEYLAKFPAAERKKHKIPDSIYKTNPAHIKGARYSNKHFGTHFGRGSKPRWTYVNEVPPDHILEKQLKTKIKYIPDTDVIAFDRNTVIPPEYKIDIQKVLKRRVQKKVNEILEWDGIEFLLYDKKVKKKKVKKEKKKRKKKKKDEKQTTLD
jgi:DNA polymerase elongation subunit (family B)